MKLNWLIRGHQRHPLIDWMTKAIDSVDHTSDDTKKQFSLKKPSHKIF